MSKVLGTVRDMAEELLSDSADYKSDFLGLLPEEILQKVVINHFDNNFAVWSRLGEIIGQKEEQLLSISGKAGFGMDDIAMVNFLNYTDPRCLPEDQARLLAEIKFLRELQELVQYCDVKPI